MTLVAGIFVAFRLSEAPEPAPHAPKAADAEPVKLDSQAAATSMAQHLALGNPEVLQHIAWQLERDTGCQAQVKSHVVDAEDQKQVAEERRARAQLLAELQAEPTVESASHGSANLADGTSVFHVLVAVVC